MFENIDAIDNNSIDADICIVGTGPAGITLARELIASKLRVVVLESGSLEFEEETQELYSGEILDELPPVSLDTSRLRYFGGTSNHWGGSSGPLSEIDFQQRSWVPHSGWPISRKELDPYYERAHKIIGLGPFNFSPEFWNKGPNGKNLYKLDGTSIEHRVRQVHAQRFGEVYRTELKRAKNIQVIFHANLTKISANESGSKVETLEVRSLSGKTVIVTANKIVLACGGIENARLLLASGFGERLPAIGRYYSFHPRITTAQFIMSKKMDSKNNPYDWHKVNDTRIKYQFGLIESAQISKQLPNYGAIINEARMPDTVGYSAAKRLNARLNGRHGFGGTFDDLYDVIADVGGATSQWSRRHNDHTFSLMSLDTYIDQAPHPESRVSLSNELDALGVRRSKISWTYYDFERNSVRKFNETLALAFGSGGLGRLKLNAGINDDAMFRDKIGDISGGGHQIGTTRMSVDQQFGVVDSNCKIHGIENIYCAGSSVFTTSGWMNPTATIVALAARLADHLVE